MCKGANEKYSYNTYMYMYMAIIIIMTTNVKYNVCREVPTNKCLAGMRGEWGHTQH